jgi:signal transduction histidine kinase
MKIQFKSNILLLSGFFIIISIFGGFVFLFEDTYSNDDFFKLLEVNAKKVAKLKILETEDLKEGLVTDLEEEFPKETNYIFKLLDTTNFSKEAKVTGLPEDFFSELKSNNTNQFVSNKYFTKGIVFVRDNIKYIIISSAENYMLLHQRKYLVKTLIISVLAASLIAIIISIYLSKVVFLPITRIANKVKQINLENLHLRLEQKGENDELDSLTKTFNDLLNRMETAFNTQNNFISNASHELRTPLTAIIGEADVTLSKLRTVDEYIDTIKIILEEAENLDKKTQALLFLAQTGFNGKTLKMGKVRMDQLLWDVKVTVEKINPKNKMVLDMSLLPENPMKLKVNGNDQLLHQALSNIILNGCKYSNFKPVQVSLNSKDPYIYITIKDEGIGIPDADMPFIYDPFFRGSNTSNFEGFGIGLPLTRNILNIHGGELQITSFANKGTTVIIKLPIGNF